MKNNSANGIIHLSEEEKQDPLLVILELFDYGRIYHLRVFLWQYLKAATSRIGWHQLGQPLDAVVLQKRLEKLMEACWLLLQKKEARDGQVLMPGFTPGSLEWLEDDRQMHLERYRLEDDFGADIQCLRRRELAYPVLVLKEFFNTQSLDEWKALLSEWTEYALCATSLLQDTENYDLLLHHDQLERLLEVSYYFTLLLDCQEDILGEIAEQQAPADTALTHEEQARHTAGE